MWLGWPKTFDIYIGTTVAMVGSRGRNAQLIRLSPTWPLTKILHAIEHQSLLHSLQSLSNHSVLQQKIKLKITLSGRWCSAWAPSLPEGLNHFDELHAYFAGIGRPPGRGENPAIEFDATNPHVAACLDLVAINRLQVWASEQNAIIQSLKPLWSVATECKLANNSSITGLVCMEPDGVTMLHSGGGAAFLPIDKLQDQQKVAIEQWKIVNDLSPHDTLTLSFTPDSKCETSGTPRLWSSHWSVS